MAPSPSRSTSSDGGSRRPRRTAVPVTAGDVGDVEGRSFRSSGQTVVCAVMAVLWPLVLCTLAISAFDEPVLATALAAGGIVGCVLYARAAQMRLDVDEEGITVVGLLRSRRVPWDDVVGVVAGYEGLRVLVPEGKGPVLHSISRTRRAVTLGVACWADAVAERLTEEARARQSTATGPSSGRPTGSVGT
ncbi:PH domain-containing protein [Iamia sp. SCSIO 61187]|uniref:PH domain-containing protein n=1 Tax=Iamia sp. SCSIO 61187 TaxID=2722752 RepID=UPI001C639178|nr:PH domain-containing protein [Iamia sp. SCSIO 61187]QYG93167.1 PH domain-containing protein [Iamia sp. SCSIO 61187]